MKKSKSVGARKANDQITIARSHYTKAMNIIDEYEIRTPEIEQADCTCDLAEIEYALMELEEF